MEDADNIHVISFRKATRYETELLFSQIKAELPAAAKSGRQSSSDTRTSRGRPKHIAKGIVRRGLKVAGPKEPVSLRIDADVLNWFKAGGVGYQTRINAVLRAYKDAAAG